MSYKPMSDFAGVKTLVTRKNHVGLPSDESKSYVYPGTEDFKDPGGSIIRDRALPVTDPLTRNREIVMPSAQYNTPIFQKSPFSGFDDVVIGPRSPGVPGEQYGHPVKEDYGYITRRKMAKKVAKKYLLSFFRETKPAHLFLLTDGDHDSLPGEKNSIAPFVDEKKRPAHDLGLGGISQSSPGSARVIPTNSDFRNHRRTLFAFVSINSLEKNISKEIIERSKNYKPRKLLFNKKLWFWKFEVGKYKVILQARLRKNSSTFKGASFKVFCSCPYWKWSGPKYWASEEGYQKGKKKETVPFPKVRDPQHMHACCKHAYAALNFLKNQSSF